jgi:hypothetical protein
MYGLNCFVLGEMDLEDAMHSTRGSDPVRVFVTWRDGDMILGIQERDAASVFTRIPVAAGTGLYKAARRVFDALDALPPREMLAGQQPPFPATAFPVPNVRPVPSTLRLDSGQAPLRAGLVSALTALAKEAMSHADR